jgi:hypothetical protein
MTFLIVGINRWRCSEAMGYQKADRLTRRSSARRKAGDGCGVSGLQVGMCA